MKRADLGSGLTVSGQLEAGDFAELAQAGVRRVVNTRPDGEKPGQLATADAARIAAENGIEYRHIPVTMATLSMDAVQAFGDAVPGDGTVVHAHCGSGLRAAILWGLNQIVTGRLDRDTARHPRKPEPHPWTASPSLRGYGDTQ
ncbi:MAG: hypothetical protein EON55_15660, partial [Alphaproteobacteria bacterium]